MQPTEVVARELLGCTLHRRWKNGRTFSARIAETEAYLGLNDPASHAYKGETLRNKSMFAEGGIFYVYLIYGMYYCVNVVTQPKGVGEAVLIRALQPLDGSKDPEIMGPGRLCRYLDITKQKFDGVPCDGDELWIEREVKHPKFDVDKLESAGRVGLNPKLGEAVLWKLRFHLPEMSTVKAKSVKKKKTKTVKMRGVY